MSPKFHGSRRAVESSFFISIPDLARVLVILVAAYESPCLRIFQDPGKDTYIFVKITHEEHDENRNEVPKYLPSNMAKRLDATLHRDLKEHYRKRKVAVFFNFKHAFLKKIFWKSSSSRIRRVFMQKTWKFKYNLLIWLSSKVLPILTIDAHNLI